MIDMHNYPGPGMPAARGRRAAVVLGEFGGLGLPRRRATPGRTRRTGATAASKTADELTDAYVDLLAAAASADRPRACRAAVYTQTTDVEIEVQRPDDLRPRGDQGRRRPSWPRCTPQLAAPPPEIIDASCPPRPGRQGRPWRYTTEKPADGWTTARLRRRGVEGRPGRLRHDGHARRDRRHRVEDRPTSGSAARSSSPARKLGDLQLLIHHDEDAEVYINGVLAAKLDGFTTDYGARSR